MLRKTGMPVGNGTPSDRRRRRVALVGLRRCISATHAARLRTINVTNYIKIEFKLETKIEPRHGPDAAWAQ